VLGKHELDEMLAERDKLNADIQEILDSQTDAWGIKVANVEIKHVDIDESMVRAIARQAEAERERRAKVINAEGEQQAAQKLVEAGAHLLDDIIAAGARITLRPAARIGGDAVLAGGRLRIEAPIEGGLRAAGRDILLDGAVAGDVYLEGRSIVIGPNARIGGALTYRGHSVQIAPATQITGEVTALQPRPRPNLRPLAGIAMWAAAALLFGLFLMAVVISAAFPRLMNDTADVLRTRPLSMLGLGAALAILTPVAVLVLIVTLLGLPLAFVLGAAFALLWPLALVGAVYAGAMLARARLRRNAAAPSTAARALWAGAAMIVFILLGLIPVIGFIVWLVAYLFGLGAVSLQAARAWAKPAAAAV
jgi:hypothetical protein